MFIFSAQSTNNWFQTKKPNALDLKQTAKFNLPDKVEERERGVKLPGWKV